MPEPARPTSALMKRWMKELTTAPDGLNLIETFHEVYLAAEVEAALKEAHSLFLTAERLRREDGASHINEQIAHAEQIKTLRAEVARLTRERDAARAALDAVFTKVDE